MKLGSKYCLAAVDTLLVLFAGLKVFGADALAEETAISRNGIWRIRPVGGEEPEMAVPNSWERASRLKVDIATLVTTASRGTRSNLRRLTCETRFRMRRSR